MDYAGTNIFMLFAEKSLHYLNPHCVVMFVVSQTPERPKSKSPHDNLDQPNSPYLFRRSNVTARGYAKWLSLGYLHEPNDKPCLEVDE